MQHYHFLLKVSFVESSFLNIFRVLQVINYTTTHQPNMLWILKCLFTYYTCNVSITWNVCEYTCKALQKSSHLTMIWIGLMALALKCRGHCLVGIGPFAAATAPNLWSTEHTIAHNLAKVLMLLEETVAIHDLAPKEEGANINLPKTNPK